MFRSDVRVDRECALFEHNGRFRAIAADKIVQHRPKHYVHKGKIFVYERVECRLVGQRKYVLEADPRCV